MLKWFSCVTTNRVYCNCSEWWSMQDSAWVCLRGKTIQRHTAMEILLLKMQLDAFDLWQVHWCTFSVSRLGLSFQQILHGGRGHSGIHASCSTDLALHVVLLPTSCCTTRLTVAQSATLVSLFLDLQMWLERVQPNGGVWFSLERAIRRTPICCSMDMGWPFLTYLFRLCFNQCNASLHFGSSKHSAYFQKNKGTCEGFCV